MLSVLCLYIPEGGMEKEMATQSNILAWRIPWTEEPGRLQSMGFQDRHAWATNTHTKGEAEGRVEFGLRQGPNSICTADLSLLWILMWKGPANITPQRLYLGSFNRVHGSTVSPRAPPGNTHQWLARPSAPLLFHLPTIGIARLSSQKLISGSKSKQTQLFDLLSF